MAPKAKSYGGVFANMEFPEYQYEHYPLMLIKGNGKAVQDQLVVENEAEEKAAIADGWVGPERVGPSKSLTQKELDAKDSEIEELKRQLAAASKGHVPAPPPPAPPPPAPAAKPTAAAAPSTPAASPAKA